MVGFQAGAPCPFSHAYIGLLLAAAPSHAVLPDEILKDAGLEKRARALSQNLRCLVCQNQSIDDSDAPLARDLRVLVRERLTAGDTDAKAMDYIVARYGTFVLLKPPMQSNTLLLWLMPLLLLAGAVIGFRRHLRARAGASTAHSRPHIRRSTAAGGATGEQGSRLTAGPALGCSAPSSSKDRCSREQSFVNLLPTTQRCGRPAAPICHRPGSRHCHRAGRRARPFRHQQRPRRMIPR